LPAPRCYRRPGRCRRTVSVGVTRPSSLVPAHASVQIPPIDFGCPSFFRSMQVATSPCCKMDLPDDISAVCVKVLGSVPRHDQVVHLSVSSYLASVSPQGQQDRLVRLSRKTASRGASISGLQPFANVQAPLLAWPANCSDRGTLCSSRPPGRIHRAELASLPRASTGITTCPKPDN
jgi:hypothetical protein